MASFKEVITGFIRAKFPTGKIWFGSKATYKSVYTRVDFALDDLINLRTALSLLGSYGGGLMVPFTGASSFTISDWQTDIPSGAADTYVNIFGNQAPKVGVWVGNDADGYSLLTSLSGMLGPITGGALSSVSYDWGESFDGFVQF